MVNAHANQTQDEEQHRDPRSDNHTDDYDDFDEYDHHYHYEPRNPRLCITIDTELSCKIM